jgi:hypothetical protein
LTGNAQLFITGHGSAGRLLAIAQGGVENNQFVSHVHSWSKTRKSKQKCKRPVADGIRAFWENVCVRYTSRPWGASSRANKEKYMQ